MRYTFVPAGRIAVGTECGLPGRSAELREEGVVGLARQVCIRGRLPSLYLLSLELQRFPQFSPLPLALALHRLLHLGGFDILLQHKFVPCRGVRLCRLAALVVGLCLLGQSNARRV